MMQAESADSRRRQRVLVVRSGPGFSNSGWWSTFVRHLRGREPEVLARGVPSVLPAAERLDGGVRPGRQGVKEHGSTAGTSARRPPQPGGSSLPDRPGLGRRPQGRRNGSASPTPSIDGWSATRDRSCRPTDLTRVREGAAGRLNLTSAAGSNPQTNADQPLPRPASTTLPAALTDRKSPPAKPHQAVP